MVSSLLILVLIQACRPEELPREKILSWFSTRILEGLRLDQPPLTHQKVQNWAVLQHDGARHEHERALGSSRETQDMGQNTGLQQETTQIILFPSSGRKILQLPEKFTFTYLFVITTNTECFTFSFICCFICWY